MVVSHPVMLTTELVSARLARSHVSWESVVGLGG